MTPVSGDVIGKAIQTVPEIIRAAAQSLNGILALMILILGTLGYFTIRKAGAKERVGVFVMLFAGVVLFGVAVVQSQRRDLVPSKIATPSPTAQMPPAQPAAPPFHRTGTQKTRQATLGQEPTEPRPGRRQSR